MKIDNILVMSQWCIDKYGVCRNMVVYVCCLSMSIVLFSFINNRTYNSVWGVCVYVTGTLNQHGEQTPCSTSRFYNFTRVNTPHQYAISGMAKFTCDHALLFCIKNSIHITFAIHVQIVVHVDAAHGNISCDSLFTLMFPKA